MASIDIMDPGITAKYVTHRRGSANLMRGSGGNRATMRMRQLTIGDVMHCTVLPQCHICDS